MIMLTIDPAHEANTITGLDRPFGIQVGEAPRISGQSAHGDGKTVSRRHRTPVLHRAIVRTEGTS